MSSAPAVALPTANIPHRPATWSRVPSGRVPYTAWPWHELAPLPPFILADGSGPALQQTTTRVCYDQDALYVRFDCHDTDIWGTLTARDSHIFNEEVVELFIAPGDSTPTHYVEFEVSPLGTLLDLTVYNPNDGRDGIRADFAWDCPGLIWSAECDIPNHHWRAYLIVPWAGIAAPTPLPRTWRANFYRIERPQDRGCPLGAEFSCWSPTLTEPANYHRPSRFGHLVLADPA